MILLEELMVMTQGNKNGNYLCDAEFLLVSVDTYLHYEYVFPNTKNKKATEPRAESLHPCYYFQSYHTKV